MGFPASAEALRILTDALDFVRKGQLVLRGVPAGRERPLSPEARLRNAGTPPNRQGK